MRRREAQKLKGGEAVRLYKSKRFEASKVSKIMGNFSELFRGGMEVGN